MLLTTPYARAVDLKPDNPIGGRYLEPNEVKELKNYVVNCEIAHKNLKSTEKSLDTCINEPNGTRWYQEPRIIVGGMVLSLGVGLGLGYLFFKR